MFLLNTTLILLIIKFSNFIMVEATKPTIENVDAQAVLTYLANNPNQIDTNGQGMVLDVLKRNPGISFKVEVENWKKFYYSSIDSNAD